MSIFCLPARGPRLHMATAQRWAARAGCVMRLHINAYDSPPRSIVHSYICLIADLHAAPHQPWLVVGTVGLPWLFSLYCVVAVGLLVRVFARRSPAKAWTTVSVDMVHVQVVVHVQVEVHVQVVGCSSAECGVRLPAVLVFRSKHKVGRYLGSPYQPLIPVSP